MITRIHGKLSEVTSNSIIIDLEGLHYEVFVAKNLVEEYSGKSIGDPINLVTYYYIQTDPSRSTPILIGFKNAVEREFFEKFITVSGIGPKAALRALSVPISQIATAIDQSDRPFLKTLPGVGDQRAREIIAKLQGKVGRFGLIQNASKTVSHSDVSQTFREEALAVLLQLEYRKEEARQMIDRALQSQPSIKNVEDLLNEVYRQRSCEEVVS